MAGWFDNSPFVPNRAGPGGADPLTPAQFDYIVSTYAELVTRTAAAVARQARFALLSFCCAFFCCWRAVMTQT